MVVKNQNRRISYGTTFDQSDLHDQLLTKCDFKGHAISFLLKFNITLNHYSQ